MSHLEVHDAEVFSYDDKVVLEGDAYAYAEQVAAEALTEYIENEKKKKEDNMGTTTRVKEELDNTLDDLKTESKASAMIISGEILLENIETLAEKFVLSRLSLWQRLTFTRKNREAATTLAVYGIVQAIKTGGFGLLPYKINHVALDYITLAANKRLMRMVVKATGVDTNIVETLLTVPTITKVQGE